MSIGINLAERGVLPDGIVRHGIRQLLRQRIDSLPPSDDDQPELIEALRTGPVAVRQDAANAQHYEVPAAFFERYLGRHLKYSCALWGERARTLDDAEAAMLAMTCGRAGLADGMDILEIGCGWGSLTLWMAERYPAARIRALSNSRSQREFIEARAAERGLTNIAIETGDLAEWHTPARYDRIVSVECLEHMRNHEELLRRCATWLRPEGRAFIHVFTHRSTSYLFEEEGEDNWMGRHFFSGGIMPAFDLLRRYDRDLEIERDWSVNGTHYARTARAWLDKLDANHEELLALFARDLGSPEAKRTLNRWRIFSLACEELWGWDQGREWPIGHYLLRPRR